MGAALAASPAEPRPIAARYEAATDLLAALHREQLPETLPLTPGLTHAIPVFDTDALLTEASLMLDWYLPDRGFADALYEDYKIRRYIKKNLAAAAISHVEIERAGNRVKVTLHTAKPGIITSDVLSFGLYKIVTCGLDSALPISGMGGALCPSVSGISTLCSPLAPTGV